MGKKILKSTVVLQEVYDELEKTGAPVDVLCSIEGGFVISDVIKLLNELEIEVRGDDEDQTDCFVFATLKNDKQALSIDKQKKELKKLCVNHVWLDKVMAQCVEESQRTINAQAARQLFNIDGKDVHWAVLDSGIDVNHPWFTLEDGFQNFDQGRQFDSTGEGIGYADSHGTHVAGIITKIAPRIKLSDYKVLGKNGGSSSTIIKAMYKIRKENFEAGKVVIHGVNMSLGGPVKVGSYGCGWSPECQEANRLVSSGVIVCVAAGNDGYKSIATVSMGKLEIFPTFTDLGITDPGNAEDVITVGSIHKSRPHSFGPSFFSSKGPTGDGRFKPDCVAPGERIKSANAGNPDKPVMMDGTSMATPHVSGAIAVFLSAKPEFKGQARKVKEILLHSCTDLKRDRNFQGEGLVDVLRMIQSV
ncbi:MAG: S8 family peptidase [Desulfobacteraceae bacterium]|nr:S8 family peptidase [Desulfobacteraceae bacterium]